MRRSASPLRLRTELFVLAVALVAVGAVRPGAQSHASAFWKVPRTPWGAPDLQGVWTSADLSAPSAEAPRAPVAGAGAGGGDVNPPNHWGERAQRVTFDAPPMTPLGQERAATPRLGFGSFMSRQLRRPRRAWHVGAVSVARHAGRHDADGVQQQLSNRAVAGSCGCHSGNDS